MDKLTLLSKKYGDNLLIRTCICAIPNIGGSLDVILTDKWNVYNQNRIEDFLDKLSKELKLLDEKSINKEFIYSEEFYDIVYQILKDVTSSRVSEKRTIYSKILKEALSENTKTCDLESLIEQVGNIKEKDMLFLKYLQKYFASKNELTGEDLSTYISENNFDVEEVTRLLFRFAYLGILDYSMNVLTMRRKIRFSKTNLFSKLCEYIS